MKNKKSYIETFVFDEIDDDFLIEQDSDKSKKIAKFRKDNPKKPKSKHHQSANSWADEVD